MDLALLVSWDLIDPQGILWHLLPSGTVALKSSHKQNLYQLFINAVKGDSLTQILTN